MARPISKSLYEWCIENSRMDVLELWDYELNKCSPKDIGYGTQKKYYFKCPRGIHKSELKCVGKITTKGRKLICNQCNSVGQYLIDTYGENALDKYWDYRINKVNPFEIAKRSTIKVWIKCQDVDYHDSYEVTCDSFYNGNRCVYCSSHKIHPKDSFGQMLVNEYGSLDGIWDFEKNGDLDTFGLGKKSDKSIWLFCLEKEYHGSYKVRCSDFTKGSRCPYCVNKKVHPKDSLGQKLIDDYGEDAIKKYWSKKNKISPFEVAPYSMKKYWFICQNDEEHEDYEMTASNFSYGKRCGKCRESYGERVIAKWLNSKNIKYIREKTFPNLLGVGNDYLRYDFYLLDQNLLVEYQGEQHESPQDFDGKGKEKAYENFLKQQEHDRRKREYAEQNGIRLLEIWYWDFDNIETILNKNIK